MFRRLLFILTAMLFSIFSYAQPSGALESALELMADTASWVNATEYIKVKKSPMYVTPNIPAINLNLK
jgi:hypothetical protein